MIVKESQNMNILFVCTGNTCRSPMAEGIARVLGQEKGMNVVTLSAGLFADYGAKVSPEAVEAVKDLVDISEHESRPIQMEFVNAADLIIGMTEEHKKVLLRQFPSMEQKIKTLAEWGGGSDDVADPYGQSQEVYNACAKQMTQLIDAGLDVTKAQGMGL